MAARLLQRDSRAEGGNAKSGTMYRAPGESLREKKTSRLGEWLLQRGGELCQWAGAHVAAGPGRKRCLPLRLRRDALCRAVPARATAKNRSGHRRLRFAPLISQNERAMRCPDGSWDY